MPLIALELKAELENVDELKPKPEWADFRWHLKIRCTNCGEEQKHWHYVVAEEAFDMGRGAEAHFVEKCKLCGRQNTLSIVMDSFKAYAAEKNGEFQPIVKFDCRGIEPTDFDPRGQWCARCTESDTIFDDIDLSEKEWADYDEKAKCSVEIKELVARFVLTKK